MATQSMPTVSWRSIRKASFSFVPTPSVPLTRTGPSPLGGSKAPPNAGPSARPARGCAPRARHATACYPASRPHRSRPGLPVRLTALPRSARSTRSTPSAMLAASLSRAAASQPLVGNGQMRRKSPEPRWPRRRWPPRDGARRRASARSPTARPAPRSADRTGTPITGSRVCAAMKPPGAAFPTMAMTAPKPASRAPRRRPRPQASGARITRTARGRRLPSGPPPPSPRWEIAVAPHDNGNPLHRFSLLAQKA